MKFQDALTLDAPKRTKDGYLVVRARAARSGVYDYAGFEIDPDNAHGLRDRASVNVLRDEATVFDGGAAQSFIGKPITDNHPTEAVTADNWKRYARGTVMGAMRDGEYLAFDLMLTDADAIKAVDGGKRELSNGYEAELEFGDFTAHDGTKCQARQKSIRGNHVALVDKGRAGPECRIKDSFAVCDANPAALEQLSKNKETTVSEVITMDGLPVDLGNPAAVKAALVKVEDRAAKAEQVAADAKTDHSEATGKIAVLEKELADAKAASEPAAIEAAVTARAALIADAKKVDPDAETDGLLPEEIKKRAMKKKLGDSVDAMDAATINGAFLMAVKTADAKPVDGLAKAISDAAPTALADDMAKLRRQSLAALGNAYKGA